MKILFTIFSFCFLVSCPQQIKVQSQVELQNNSVKEIEKLSKPLENLRLPEIKKLGEYGFIRHSETKDEKGWMLPPYQYAELTMNFEDEPSIGEKVTIVPLEVEIEPFQLEILKTVKTKSRECSKTNEPKFFWAAEFEKITNQKILEIKSLKNYNPNMPFGVFLIYPAVEFAKSLNKSSISKANLPKNVSLKRIESAIDLDNDGKADLVSVGFCCGEPEKESIEKCPYQCEKYYKKTAGVWKIFNIRDIRERC